MMGLVATFQSQHTYQASSASVCKEVTGKAIILADQGSSLEHFQSQQASDPPSPAPLHLTPCRP